MEGRNVLQKVAQIRPLILPLTRQTLRSIDQVTIAIENRAFGAGPVTPLYDVRLDERDRVVCIAIICIATVLLAGSLLWNWGSL